MLLVMKNVSVRNFQQNMYQHLGDMPLCITKYNKPAFYIVKEAPTNSEQPENIGHEDTNAKNPVLNATKAQVAK